MTSTTRFVGSELNRQTVPSAAKLHDCCICNGRTWREVEVRCERCRNTTRIHRDVPLSKTVGHRHVQHSCDAPDGTPPRPVTCSVVTVPFAGIPPPLNNPSTVLAPLRVSSRPRGNKWRVRRGAGEVSDDIADQLQRRLREDAHAAASPDLRHHLVGDGRSGRDVDVRRQRRLATARIHGDVAAAVASVTVTFNTTAGMLTECRDARRSVGP